MCPSSSVQKKNKRQARGFTIIELMVTVSIVVLVTGLIMIQYASFNNSVLLRNQAFRTGFDIREAQALAVGVKGQGSEFREEYGLYFDMDTVRSYLLFQDNGRAYPARYNENEEIGVPYLVDPRFVISDICVENASSRICNSTDSSVNNLTVSFRRPDFEAVFYSPSKTNIQSAEIIFSIPSGSVSRSVTIYKTGQISVK